MAYVRTNDGSYVRTSDGAYVLTSDLLELSCPEVLDGQVGIPYVSALIAILGTAPYTYAILSGALPTGLSLDPATGAITGTPSVAGTFAFTAGVTDAASVVGQITCAITIEARVTGCDDGAVGTPLTLADALDQLAGRLDDTAFVHWTQDELTRVLIEALRTTSAYTQRWRNRGEFAGSVNVPFYDLPSILPDLRGYNVTDTETMIAIEYALMEFIHVPYAGTEQFSGPLIIAAMQGRLNQFLNDTGAVLQRSLTTVTPDAKGRITLPQNVMAIRRAAWIMADGTVVPLTLESEWGMSHYIPAWPQNPTKPTDTWPTGYSVGVTPPLTVQLAPAPTTTGTLDLIAVVTGPTLNPEVGVLLGIPDDWTWVVKWGALADLLSRDGLAFDPLRAAYCEARYQQGVTLAKAASVVLQGYVNGATVLLKSLVETDQYRRNWQTVAGAPMSVLTSCQNLVGLNPKPNGLTQYTIALDLVVNVLIPSQLTDCLQIDQQMRDPFFDLAQHLATFKEGPGQLEQSMPLYERFTKACGVTVALDQAQVPNRGPLMQQTVQDTRIKAQQEPPEPTLP